MAAPTTIFQDRRVILATHEYLPFRGGVAVYVHEVALAAVGLGFNLEIWTAERRGHGEVTASKKSFADPLNSSGGPPVVRFASNGRLTLGGLWSLARGWWRRRGALRKNPVVLLSVGAQMIFFWFDLLGIVPARETFVFFHGSELLRFSRSPVWRWLARRYYAKAGGSARVRNTRLRWREPAACSPLKQR